MNAAVLRALLPRLEGRSRLGLAGEFLYLWLNLMAAVTLLSVAARALPSPLAPGEIAVLWLFGALLLRVPAVVAALMRTRPKPAEAATTLPSLPAAPRRSPRAGAVDGFASAPKEAGSMLGTRRAGHRGRIVGR